MTERIARAKKHQTEWKKHLFSSTATYKTQERRIVLLAQQWLDGDLTSDGAMARIAGTIFRS